MKYEILIRILFMLLSRKGKVTAAEIASRFEISRRTVYRYMDTLTLANVPIMVDQGTNGGYYISDTYKLNTFLTEKELSTLTEILKSFESVFPDRDISFIRDKLFNSKLSEQAAISSSSLIIDGTNWANGNSSPKISVISNAIENCRLLDISYHDANGNITKRTIEPHALALKNGLWYVFAYCHLRDNFRLFKLSRIEYANLGESFEKRQFNVELLPVWEWQTEDKTIDIELEIESSAKSEVEEWIGIENIYTSSDGKIKANARLPFNKTLVSQIMKFGSSVKVIKPKQLKKEILKVSQDLVNLYK